MSIAYDYFYTDVEPLEKYSPAMLNLSPAARVLIENPVIIE